MAATVHYKVGDSVREIGGQDGVITGIRRPMGYMECHIKTTKGSDIIRFKHELKKISNESRILKLHTTQNPTLPPEVVEELNKPEEEFFSHTPKRKFIAIEDNDVEAFIENSANQNTQKKTKSNMTILFSFISSTMPDEEHKIEHFSPEKLNAILSKFFITITKENGESYEPGSLRGFFQSFQRFLKRKQYPCNIMNDPAFQQTRDALAAKQKVLKSDGKGNVPNKASSLSDREVEQIYDAGQIGTHHPEAIINGLWWYNTTHFGLRGITAHRNMRWGDVILKTDPFGEEYLEYNERATKTRTGPNTANIRQVPPRAWATPAAPDRCPVELFKEYSARRPSHCSGADDPFYIATTTVKEPTPESTWFRAQPIGKRKIGAIMKTMALKSGLQGSKRITNHSARKTMIQKLVSNDVPPTHIVQISGHKNLNSLNAYSSITQEQHRNISKLISYQTPSNQVSTEIAKTQTQVRPAQHTVSSADLENLTGDDIDKDIKSIFSGNLNNCTITININKTQETTHSISVSQQNK
ncbi:uncharacterized protein KIAA1958-like [Littorina saxatilis]|uniref:Tyr recombinase domain-containing protein n=1 Tax=Littorina saxatilis TaxID=31220 RepID=A0AAN9AQM4_9CAEN